MFKKLLCKRSLSHSRYIDIVCISTIPFLEIILECDMTKRCFRFLHISNSKNVEASDKSWLSKLLVRRIEPTKESHSRMLSDKEVVYALHTHNIRPDSVDKYMKN